MCYSVIRLAQTECILWIFWNRELQQNVDCSSVVIIFFLYTYTYIFSKQKSHKRNITQLAPSGKKIVNAYGLNMQQWENRAKLDEYMCASNNIVDISRSSICNRKNSKNKWIRHEDNSIHDILTFYWALSNSFVVQAHRIYVNSSIVITISLKWTKATCSVFTGTENGSWAFETIL